VTGLFTEMGRGPAGFRLIASMALLRYKLVTCAIAIASYTVSEKAVCASTPLR